MAGRGLGMARRGLAGRGRDRFFDRESEASARKGRQGPLVREGLMIERVSFRYDVERYGEALEEVVKDGAVHGAERQAHLADPGEVRLPVVGGRRGRRRRGAGGQGGVAGAARPPHRVGRLASGEERRLRPVRRRGRDRADRRGGGAFPPGPAGQGRHARQG